MKLNVKYIVDHENELWKQIRWNETPVCQCGSTELYHLSDGRFKCKHCKKIFSDTTNTIAEHSNLKKWQWLYAIFVMTTTKSISVRELAKHISVSTKTAYNMIRKIRYYMSKEQISMTNIAIIDEAHIGAWSNMTLRKKFAYMKEHGFIDPKDNTYTKHQIFAASSHKKEHIVCMVNEFNQCIIKHIRGQINHKVIKTLIKQYKVSHIVSDESKLYLNIPNTTVEQCNHSKRVWLTKTGKSTNPCENRFSWVKRIYAGYHTHISADFLQLYLNQVAFKINNSKLTSEERFKKLGKLCCEEYISHKGIAEFLRATEIVNKPKEIDPQILEVLNYDVIDKIEFNHKVFRKG